MPSFKFKGFTTGSTVALTIAQGATTAQQTVTAWGTTTGGGGIWEGALADQTLVLNVTVRSPSGAQFAPLPVVFETSITSGTYVTPADDTVYDASFHRVTYVVLTGDTGQWRNEWVADATHRDKAFAYGQRAPHCYSAPGSYTARVFAYDDTGKWGMSNEIVIGVQETTAAIPASRTVVIDPTNTFTGAPAHDIVNRCNTLAQARTRFDALKSGGPVRICGRNGQSVTDNGSFTGNGFRHLFDTWGTGDRFKVLMGRVSSGSFSPIGPVFNTRFAHPFAISGWDFDLGWDSANGVPKTGSFTSESHWPLLWNTDPDLPGRTAEAFSIFHNCNVADWISFNAEIRPAYPLAYTFFVDTDFTAGGDYHFFAGSNLNLIGCRFLEVQGSCLGLLGRNMRGGSNRGGKAHRGFRAVSYAMHLRGCFIEARGGWSGKQDGPGVTGYAPQPWLRATTSSVGCRYHFVGNVFAAAANLDSGAQVHFLLENNVFIADPSFWTDMLLRDAVGRKTLRNNVFVNLSIPKRANSYYAGLGRNTAKMEDASLKFETGEIVRFLDTPVTPSSDGEVFPQDGPLENLHNMFVSLKPGGELSSSTWVRNTNNDGQYTIVEGHNVLHAPGLSITPSGGVSSSPLSMRILPVWFHVGWEIAFYTLPSPVAPGGQTPIIPYPNDWYNNPTTQASYASTAGNNAFLCSNGTSIFSYAQVNFKNQSDSAIKLGTSVFEFLPSGFRVTNNSTDTWAAGSTRALLDRGSSTMTPDIHDTPTASEVAVYWPTAPQAMTPGVRSTLFDFKFQRRPNAGFAISPAGTNAAGPLLPA